MLDKILYQIKRLIPKSVFDALAPLYHTALAYAGALHYGFPSRSMKVIGVTGTKGKSTTVYLLSKMFEDGGVKVAAVGSLGFKIKDKEWPNTLKMTMPGRMKLQKFLADAKKAGCTHVIMEVTSEGIKQKRHLGINFDGAVFTNLHKEHIEAHGSFGNYRAAKEELFATTNNIHVINADDPNMENFSKYPSKKTIFFGLKSGDMRAINIRSSQDQNMTEFDVFGVTFKTHLVGEFNIYNCLAALATGAMYGLDLPTMQPILAKIDEVKGRMQFIPAFVKTSSYANPAVDKLAGEQHFKVVVDYAHTPDSLEAVYQTLRKLKTGNAKLIAVLGAAGGGRDKWKRPEFGRMTNEYCDEIILTNEDPYDENPDKILIEIEAGINDKSKVKKIIDRKEAIKKALTDAKNGDIVVITGKGSETSMALAGGRKIPWSDTQTVRDLLQK